MYHSLGFSLLFHMRPTYKTFAVDLLTSEDKSPNYITSGKNADFDDNSFERGSSLQSECFDLQ